MRSLYLILSLTVLLVMSVIGSAVEAANLSDIHKNPCYKCHKRNGSMLGVHANNALAISCNDCHGEKQGHPRKASDLIAFTPSASQADKQNNVCLNCHRPQLLGQVDWTHNVHSNKVSCASCHQLHPEYDAVLTQTKAERSQLCVKCHTVVKD